MTCFYCDKKQWIFTQDGIRWLLSDANLCRDCRILLTTRLEPEKKVVILEREKVYQKPTREIGEEG